MPLCHCGNELLPPHSVLLFRSEVEGQVDRHAGYHQVTFNPGRLLVST